jgi:acetyl esterase/lipase
MMNSLRILTATIGALQIGAGLGFAQAAPANIDIRRNLTYGTHDGVALVGDYFVPKAAGKYPVVVAVHGGGWQGGSRSAYRYWGPYLASHGIALLAIDYRLSKPGQPTFPQAVHDVRAAVQYVKHNAAELKADPERTAFMGDSAGAHLTSLVGLAGDTPTFAKGYAGDPYASISTSVKAVVATYGVYDLVAHWHHDQITRPRDQIVEKFLGKAPMDDRRVYFDASPMSYATRADNRPAFLLVWGTGDDVADPSQSENFMTALKQAGIMTRKIAVTDAPHFFNSDPLDDPSSPVHAVAPQVLRFLQGRLAPPE